MKNNTGGLLWFTASLFCSCFPSLVHAYVGPGAGLSAIGSFLALLAAILIAIVGFLWFPIKRLLRKRKNKKEAKQSVDSENRL